MRTLRIRVTAEHIEAAEGLSPSAWWSAPVEHAILGAAGVPVSIDGGGVEEGGENVNIATIGQGVVVLVVDLPTDANAWLNARWDAGWDADATGEPFAFDLEVVPDWLERALGPEQYLTLREAAEQLGVTAANLRQLADREVDGVGSPTARRLRAVKRGRDWLVPESGLATEVAHRLRQLRSIREVVER